MENKDTEKMEKLNTELYKIRSGIIFFKLYIPEHVDPPFRIMLTQHSCKATHHVFCKFKTQDLGIMLNISGMLTTCTLVCLTSL